MSAPRPPVPALLVVSALSARWDIFDPVRRALVELFGPLARETEPLAFDQTGYYDKELGTPIFRRFLAFDALTDQAELARIKLEAVALEQAHARDDGTRRFNLDPGLLTLERFVLATGKNFAHRIYLGSGVFADLTLIYTKGAYKTLEWTFPDYAGEAVQGQLIELRTMYAHMLKNNKLREERRWQEA